MHQAAQYKDGIILHDQSISVSVNGQTTNEIGLHWLTQVFDKYTKDYTIGRYRLLVLDDHSSHVTLEFDQFCLEHQIIVLCMLPHSSHLLQSLDVDCFSVLKQAYRRLVEQIMGNGVNHIDKCEFLPLYRQARQAALHQNNIQAGFAATGLVPYNPDRVLAQLHIEYRTLSPQRPQSNASWAVETPHNIAELQQQTALIRRYLKQRTHSPPSPTEQALTQLVKSCEMAMSSAVLLASENKKLQVENQRQKRKRATRRTYIARESVLSGAEGASRAQKEVVEAMEAAEAVKAARAAKAAKAAEAAKAAKAAEAAKAVTEWQRRAPSKCSMCSSTEHTARTCPTREATSQQIVILNTIDCG